LIKFIAKYQECKNTAAYFSLAFGVKNKFIKKFIHFFMNLDKLTMVMVYVLTKE